MSEEEWIAPEANCNATSWRYQLEGGEYATNVTFPDGNGTQVLYLFFVVVCTLVVCTIPCFCVCAVLSCVFLSPCLVTTGPDELDSWTNMRKQTEDTHTAVDTATFTSTYTFDRRDCHQNATTHDTKLK